MGQLPVNLELYCGPVFDLRWLRNSGKDEIQRAISRYLLSFKRTTTYPPSLNSKSNAPDLLFKTLQQTKGNGFNALG